MKYVLPISLLIVGLTAGYFVGVNSVETEIINTESMPGLVKTQVVHDTIIKKEIIEIPSSDEGFDDLDSVAVQIIDSSTIILDTISEQYLKKPVDTTLIIEEQIKIKSDTKLASKKITIIYLENNQNNKDSLIKEVLNINEVKNESIIIEFWESPINYSGYKLSKSKLIVFDLSPQFDYVIYKDKNMYYLSFQSIYYQLSDTGEFLPFVSVEKKEVFK